MKDMTWIKEGFIAHRGLHTRDGVVPENTLLAFSKAIEKGFGIELDINVLKDGTVVCFHDKDLNRLCGINQELRNLNYDDVKNIKILKSNETIHSMKEVLEFVNGSVPLLIELKPFGDHELLCRKFMEVMEGYQGLWAMHSFHPKTVFWFRMNHPEVIRGQITEYFRDDEKMKKITKYLMKTMFFNPFTKPDFINYGVKDMPNKYLDHLMKKGMTIIGYASHSQKEFDMVKNHYHNSVFEYFIPQQ